jgi:predicted small metal-binding protein
VNQVKPHALEKHGIQSIDRDMESKIKGAIKEDGALSSESKVA